MKTIIFIAALTLTGCGLTPKQMEALNGGVCFKGFGTTTTAATGKKSAVLVNGENCSIAVGAAE